MRNCLVPGVSHSLSLLVNDPALVTAFTPHLSALADSPPVFATAFMVGFMEWSCIETLQPYLLDGENTVGTHVYLNHVARTPVGRRVTARVELMEMKDRVLRFRVDCYDDCGLIGSGYHERTAVDTARVMDQVRRKAAALLAAA